MNKFKVAGVQMDIAIGDRRHNLDKMHERLQETTSAGASLTVFPECTVTGYCFSSLEEAREIAEPIDEGPAIRSVSQMCAELDTWVVFGFLELAGEHVYNALALIGKNGVVGGYRKIHLPHLGVDRFTTSGENAASVFDMPLGRIGLNICYDSSFPEAARILSLAGADLIALPTNWPPTSGLTADVIPNARALENHVYFMAVNRIGQERGFDFIGKSKICDPRGATLASANHRREEILYAEIDPTFARAKHLVNIPGEHEVHRIEDRRPELYGMLTERQRAGSLGEG